MARVERHNPVLRHTDPDFAARLRRVTGASDLFDKTIEERARAILDAVYARGDAAVLELTEKFDGAKLNAEQLAVTQAELMAASLKADATLRAAVETAHKNTRSSGIQIRFDFGLLPRA